MPKVAIPALLVLLLIIVVAGVWFVGSDVDARWAREEAIPEIIRLVEQDNYAPAFTLAEEVERVVPDDPLLADLWPQLSRTRSLNTTPRGADV